MTFPTNNTSSVTVKNLAARKLIKTVSTFVAGMVGTSLFCLGAYALTVDRLVERSAVPATYKWFLLKEIPGPRIIFESGSNSHHAIDTDAVGEALGRTAINIADNGGYALEDKLTRLETYTRPGDVVVLPLEWTFYHREKLTDNYVDTLFGSNRDYYQSMPLDKRLKRALSLPPATVISKLADRQTTTNEPTESPARDLFVSALTQPSGHQSRPNSTGPGAGVAEQSCDDYILGKAPTRQALTVGKNIKPALGRLQKLKARGVDIHFAWPVLAGEGCLTDPAYVEGFRAEIEAAVNGAGFEFLGTPGQSLYGQAYQDDSPYHIITAATDVHTRQMIEFLRAQGYGAPGEPLNITHFARHRLLELELAEASQLNQTPLEFGKSVSFDNAEQRDQIDFTAGWWAFEPYGRWMRDNRAMFRVTLPENLPSNTVLKIQGMTKSGRPEQVNISVNGNLVSSGLFGESVSLSVPVTGLPKGEALSIFIDLPEAGDPKSPKDLGESRDARSMTLHLQTMALTHAVEMPIMDEPVRQEASPLQAVETLESNVVAKRATFDVVPTLNTCSLVTPVLSVKQTELRYGNGWWAQEAEGRWMRSEEANFSITMPETIETGLPTSYLLKLTGDFFSETPDSINVTIDGDRVFAAEISDDGITSIRFNTYKAAGELEVTIKLSVPKLRSPKDLGLSTDDRTLTYFLKSVELVAA
ncbi:hypothetical protein GCM10011309_19780 [Litorimonas cladophorae]|uniref:Uncharacterized protein n=1 Tax=Litorimonas cladophorae TaxID=1220491 RepID=A0A918NFU3_9PROT|nr:hypothetical protein [Litorimonas cladophorae]GGX69797.1 hypothetical protein GCM10011309_19780 [Litorimonas cladophorae]